MDPISSKQSLIPVIADPITINDLPVEIFQKIFERIHPRDLPEKMSVCRQWNKNILVIYENIDRVLIVQAINFIIRKLQDREDFIDDQWVTVKGLDFQGVDKLVLVSQIQALLSERRMIFDGVYLPILERDYQRFIEKMADILAVLSKSDLANLWKISVQPITTFSFLLSTSIRLVELRGEIKKYIDEMETESESQEKLYEIGLRLSGHYLTDKAITLGKEFNLKEEYFYPMMENILTSNFFGREYQSLMILTQINNMPAKMKFIKKIFIKFIINSSHNSKHILKYIPLINDPETEALPYKIALAFVNGASKEEILNILLEDQQLIFEEFWIRYVYFNMYKKDTETAFKCINIIFSKKFVDPNLLHEICAHLLGNIFKDKKTMPIPERIAILNKLINEFPFFRKQQAEFVLNLFRNYCPCNIINNHSYTNSGCSPEQMDQVISLSREGEFEKAIELMKEHFEGKEIPVIIYQIIQIESALALLLRGKMEESRKIIDALDLPVYIGEKFALMSFFEI